MNLSQRSKVANEAKKQYIKEGKKASVLKKLSKRVNASGLSKLPKANKEVEVVESEPSDESEYDDNFVLHLSDDSVSDSSIDQPVPKKVRKSNRITKVTRGKIPVGHGNNQKESQEMLQLQREIELLRLEQVKQARKAVKMPKQRKETVPDQEVKQPKPKNQKAEALKTRMLVEF